LRRYWSFS